MIHRFVVGMDGTLKDDSKREMSPDEVASHIYNLVTSGASERNQTLPASMFAQGVRTIKGAADSFTRNVMAQSKPVKQRSSFDTRGTDPWLDAQKAASTR